MGWWSIVAGLLGGAAGRADRHLNRMDRAKEDHAWDGR